MTDATIKREQEILARAESAEHCEKGASTYIAELHQGLKDLSELVSSWYGRAEKAEARVAALEAALGRMDGLATRLEEFAENALRVDDRELYTAIANDLRTRLAVGTTA